MAARKGGHKDIVQMLVNKGADVNQADEVSHLAIG